MKESLDLDFVQLIAADLGVDASFIEKDWYAIRIISALTAVNTSDIKIVFSGGTSLSKAFGLIQRFSEDIDFKVILPETGVSRKQRSRYREQIVDAIRRGSSEWLLDDQSINPHNEGRFFDCQITYNQNFVPSQALRPHIKLEVTFESPALPVKVKPLQSFIAQARGQHPEVPGIACVSPIETAADKLSALTWRVLSRQHSNKQNDPTVIRHLHDLTALEETITKYQDFSNLVYSVLEKDVQRDKDLNLSAIPPIERLFKMLQALKEGRAYPVEYERFVIGMSYAPENQRYSFKESLQTLRKIINQIESGLGRA